MATRLCYETSARAVTHGSVRLLSVPRGLVELTFVKVHDDGFVGILGHFRPLFFVPWKHSITTPFGGINFVVVPVAAGKLLTS